MFWKKLFFNNSQQNLEDIEEKLLEADFGFESTKEILEGLRRREKNEEVTDALKRILAEGVKSVEVNLLDEKLNVFLLMGVNGVGKTSAIAKLISYFMTTIGLSANDVLIGAADTFRDAAIDQLRFWAEKLKVKIVAQKQGSSPSAVVFDSLESAFSSRKKLLLIDTAGRLHTKDNLLEEVNKMNRIVDRFENQAEKHNFLALDSTLGGASFSQAREFQQVSPISSLIFTKVDASPKSGSIYNIGKNLKVPVSFMTYGEKENQIKPFSSEEYINALL